MKDFLHMTSDIERAFRIAKSAHAGQKDLAGKDYIIHPMTVASSVGEDETAIIVALLHDTVEDTDVTFDFLETQFNADVVSAVRLLTHRADEPYQDYIHRIRESRNETAIRVKLADLTTNMDLSRFDDGPSKRDILRVKKKYIPAKRELLKCLYETEQSQAALSRS